MTRAQRDATGRALAHPFSSLLSPVTLSHILTTTLYFRIITNAFVFSSTKMTLTQRKQTLTTGAVFLILTHFLAILSIFLI